MSDAALAKAALARGDLIAAYDIAVRAIADGNASSAIRHQQVLALARMGDTERAMELYSSYDLGRSPHPHERAVGARLLKDRALALTGSEDREAALIAAYEAYLGVYRESGDAFPGINAATLALLAGDEAAARDLATLLLADRQVAAPQDYYGAATRAEALLVLGRTGEAAEALASEPIRAGADLGARSTTARQLEMIARHRGIGETERRQLLAPLAPPRVAHFCGHMFAEDIAAEARLRAGIDRLLDEERIGFAYGALACGADILFAEAVLERGTELHVVLPFREEDFLAQSVRPGGESWLARYRTCLDQAASLTVASPMEHFGDPAEYAYGSRLAMGLARLRARQFGGEEVQLALWDGRESDGEAGTGADVAAWIRQSGRSRTLDPGDVDRKLDRPAFDRHVPAARQLAAILFTDFAGFSNLKETALPVFWDGVMRRVAEVLESHGEEVACRNSWGDALYAVSPRAPAAAAIALEVQDRLAAFDYPTLGLDETAGMRVGAHYGPAYRTIDPITGQTTYYGTEVSKAARIEPVTPTGAVFVTEPFAAILALEAGESYACRYVGRIPLAKGYGDYPMYRLTRRG